MTAHVYHESVMTHGLNDDCPRCQEHEKDPFGSLDLGNLGRLLVDPPISRLDGVVAAKLKRMRREGLYLERARNEYLLKAVDA